ncbi:MAG: HNH endonuclease [Hyphomicrobiales bacterium]|nr:HNH endonuclease [Hyphomicrobiales bacterium]
MGGKPRGNPVTDEQIIASYRETFSSYKTAGACGLASSTVERVLRRHGEPRRGLEIYRERARKFRGQEMAIREAYEAGATYRQLREQFGGQADYAIKQAIKRAGGTLRANPAPLLKDGELDKIKELNAGGMGQVGISIAIGRSQSFVSRTMRQHNISTQWARGAQHNQWKGGRYVDSQGYVHVWVSPDDPLSVMTTRDNYAREHRVVMARKLGRPLRKEETVHHINGDNGDNRPENLQLRNGRHGKGVVLCCLDCGSRNVGPTPIH